jgi:ribosomal protein S18 acetylase RimI-like enzyme
MRMAFTIRSGQLSDAEAVLDLWMRAGAEPSHTDDVESLDILLTHDPSALIVAEAEGSLVGTVIAGWDGWRGSIYRLAVDPSHRRLGLGNRLLREAEARLSSRRAARLQAIVVDTEQLALSFWAASGWEWQIHRRRFVKG